MVLACDNNNLSTLDVSNNVDLRDLFCSNNNLTTLDVSNNLKLSWLICSNNNLSSLDVSNNLKLSWLICYNNNLSSIDVSNNVNIKRIGCNYNNLSSIDVSNNVSIENLECSYNNLSSLDVSNNINLEYLKCSNNNLSSIDVSNNVNLRYLECSYNNLSSIDVSNNVNLGTLYCDNNNLSTLDLLNNVNLKYLRCCTGNNLSSIFLPFDFEDLSSFDGPLNGLYSNEVESFVSRLYTVALGRSEVEEEGMRNWINQLVSNTETGGSAARFFCTCQEMVNRNLSNEDYVEMLYNLFFGRASDAPGKADWLGRLNTGASRESILDGFINSIEWANICASYGIESGGTAQSNLEPTENINAFIERIYTNCLGRGSDPTGLDRWGREIVNRRMTATEVAYGFFFSDEFLGFGLSDEEYIERLYLTFIDRPSDEVGRNDWLNRLRNGASRQDVFFGIANSNEFNGICESYGIYN